MRPEDAIKETEEFIQEIEQNKLGSIDILDEKQKSLLDDLKRTLDHYNKKPASFSWKNLYKKISDIHHALHTVKGQILLNSLSPIAYPKRTLKEGEKSDPKKTKVGNTTKPLDGVEVAKLYKDMQALQKTQQKLIKEIDDTVAHIESLNKKKSRSPVFFPGQKPAEPIPSIHQELRIQNEILFDKSSTQIIGSEIARLTLVINQLEAIKEQKLDEVKLLINETKKVGNPQKK